LSGSIYVHIPFCLKKCRYCDFYSVPYREELVDAYVRSVCAEIEERAGVVGGLGLVTTVYVGGGTPSLLTAGQLEMILAKIHESFGIEPGAEITVEVNPGTVDLEKMRSYRRLGVNRVSLGVQSFFDDVLRQLGRLHDSQDTSNAFDACVRAGFENINIDLIYGVPGQDSARWRVALNRAVELKPQHVSAYLLQPEPQTPLGRLVAAGEVKMLPEEEEAFQYEETIDILTKAGYRHYELSNFAQPGYECRHNLNYWQGGEYLGIGAGAVSFFNRRRYENLPDAGVYTERLSRSEAPLRTELEQLDEEGIIRERLVLGLRLIEGIDIKDLEEPLAPDFYRLFGSSVDRLEKLGLLEWRGSRLRLARRGYFLSNEVFRELL